MPHLPEINMKSILQILQQVHHALLEIQRIVLQITGQIVKIHFSLQHGSVILLFIAPHGKCEHLSLSSAIERLRCLSGPHMHYVLNKICLDHNLYISKALVVAMVFLVPYHLPEDSPANSSSGSCCAQHAAHARPAPSFHPSSSS